MFFSVKGPIFVFAAARASLARRAHAWPGAPARTRVVFSRDSLQRSHFPTSIWHILRSNASAHRAPRVRSAGVSAGGSFGGAGRTVWARSYAGSISNTRFLFAFRVAASAPGAASFR